MGTFYNALRFTIKTIKDLYIFHRQGRIEKPTQQINIMMEL